MKKFSTLVASIVLASSSTAFAQGLEKTQAPLPAPMTEAHLDAVAGGQLQIGNLVAVSVTDVANNLDVANNNQVIVAIPVNAAVAAGVGVLGRGAAAAQGTQFSRVGVVR